MISIIVPIYNAADYIQACVESLLRQTERDLQLILVDDGSTDGSLQPYEAMRREGTLDPRIELYRQPHAGQSAARNLGLQHARGAYIAFLDADDSLAPDWCEQHLKAIAGVDYVQSGYTRVATDKSRKSKDKRPYTIHQFTSPCMRLYRREAIRGLRFVEGMIYEDVVWSVDLWTSGATCRKITYTGYYYTLNPRSTTATRHPEAEQRLFRELRQRLHTLPPTPYTIHHTPYTRIIILYTIIRLKLHFLCK
ncbi:MAG: glycosyltransferase family 2 protein [Paludibacteraceae bacterium]|nr:glycosyltransferase family 2 protein [Paludibacteraceae bacterium]